MCPFQRDSPADTADYADDLIWRRLKVWNSYLLSSWANGHFWFCRFAWECFIYSCLFVCLLAFLLLRHIRVFCSTHSRRETLAFSDEYKSYSLFGVVFTTEFDVPALSVRFPRRTLVCMRSFWRMTEERTLLHWIWQIKVTFWESHTEITNRDCSKCIT